MAALRRVLAPNWPWRAAVVSSEARAGAEGMRASPSAADRKAAKGQGAKGKEGATTSPILAEHDRPQEGAAAASPRPRTSLGEGVVPPPYARIDGACLRRRVSLEAVLACPCGGRRRILRAVTDPTATVAILEPLGLRARAPPLAAAREPSWFESA